MRRVSGCKIYILLLIGITVNLVAQHNVNHNNNYKPNDFITREEYEKNGPPQSIMKNSSQNQSVFPIVKEDFLVNSLEGTYGSDQSYMKSAVDGYGNRACVWMDKRNDKQELFAQFFDANGNRVGNNIKINTFDVIGNNWPSIASNSNGDFVITYLINFNTLVAQKFNSLGQRTNGDVYVSINNGFNTNGPCVKVNDDGSYIVMCASEPGNWIYKLYARIVDKFGNLLPNELIINDENTSASGMGGGRHITTDDEGNYFITWNEFKNYSSEIYLQQYDRNGIKLGNKLLVSTEVDTSYNTFPEIASISGGNFMIVWTADNQGWPENNQTKCRSYNKQTGFLTEVITLSDTAGYATSNFISTDQRKTFYLLNNWGSQKKIIKLNLNGEIIGSSNLSDLIVPENHYSYYTDLTDVINNKLYISLAAYIKGDQEVFSKAYDTLIVPIAEIEKINDDLFSSAQREPLVCFNKYGESIVLWDDERDGWKSLYAQIYDENFNPVNGNLRIDDTQSEQWFVHNKIVRSQSDGTFIIAFTGSESYSDGDIIYFQSIDRTGNKIGNNKIVRNNSYSYPYQLAMNIDSTDETLLVFYDRYRANFRRYNKQLEPVSYEKILLNYSDSTGFYPFAVSVDENLNLFAVWKDYNLYTGDDSYYLYGQFFKKDGTKASVKNTIDSTNNYIMMLQCMNDGLKDFLFIYKDPSAFNFKRNYLNDNRTSFNTRYEFYGYNGMYQNIAEFKNKKAVITFNCYNDVKALYFNDNKRIDSVYDIHSYPYINIYSDDFNGVNSADIYNDKLLFAFESNQHGNSSSDIWANVKSLNTINFNDEYFFPKVYSDYLYNNFPNPFNSKTKIAYELLAYHKVKLSVYDILGREVSVIVDENQEKGIYEKEFDSSNLASGVYFLRLDAFNTTVKKMMILK
jgi:hypothetical protein